MVGFDETLFHWLWYIVILIYLIPVWMSWGKTKLKTYENEFRIKMFWQYRSNNNISRLIKNTTISIHENIVLLNDFTT